MAPYKIKEYVFCKFRLEGWHQWPDAKHSDEPYLEDVHRHMFHFQVWVTTDPEVDREIEIIGMRRFLMGEAARYLSPGSKLSYSCEDLARSVAVIALNSYKRAEAVYVEVSEDGENGGAVRATRS